VRADTKETMDRSMRTIFTPATRGIKSATPKLGPSARPRDASAAKP
jgi:hypothetical protein